MGGAHPAGETFGTVWALEHGGHEVGVVTFLGVMCEQLLLPEVLAADGAGEGLLPGVGARVHDEVVFLGQERQRHPLSETWTQCVRDMGVMPAPPLREHPDRCLPYLNICQEREKEGIDY